MTGLTCGESHGMSPCCCTRHWLSGMGCRLEPEHRTLACGHGQSSPVMFEDGCVPKGPTFKAWDERLPRQEKE